jgi:long-chain acyl-CoA synthetase
MNALNHPTESAAFLASLEETVPRYFWAKVHERGAKIALREKRFGLWTAVTWAEYGEKAKWTGLGLAALGLKRGDVVSVVAENIPEWLFTDMGTMGVGGVTNGIYTTDAAKQVEYLVNDSRTRFYFAENEEQLDKILDVRGRCPSLERIVVYDMEGLHDFQDPMVISYDELLALGKDFEVKNPGHWDAELAKGRADDLAILIYTSGTTGPSKGAMISHRNLMFTVQLGLPGYDMREGDEELSFLPLCHILERNLSTMIPLRTGTTINFCENLEAVPENLRELQPTVFAAVPRIWEKFYSTVAIRMKDATGLGRLAYRAALAIGFRVADQRMAGRPTGLADHLLFRLADWLVLRNVKRMIGLQRCRVGLTGAAPISPDLIRWFLALGVPLIEAYGMTETTGIITIPPFGRTKLGTVGTCCPHAELKVGAGGEILFRGPNVFMGYLNKPEKTAEAVVDGWLHTGDVGAMDNEGYVRITDRMKDIIITAGGKNITPSEIENQLKFSPYINDAVVVGDRRQYLTALIMIDHENVVKFAQDRNVPFTNFTSLCRAKEVVELIGEEIERVNRNFARVETVKKFRLIDQMLTAEDDELTPTMKLKRKFVNEKYKGLIDAMYQEGGVPA